MNMKYIKFIALIISMLLMLSGCSYVAYKDYYSDVSDYTDIWTLTGFRHGYDGASTFFPEKLENFEVVDFYCRHDEQLPLGEGTQVFLHTKYNDNNIFKKELDRVASMSFSCDEYFDNATYKAYATRLGEEYSSEYALINEQDQIIYYIYIQDLPKGEIEFDHSLLPIGYSGYGEVSI